MFSTARVANVLFAIAFFSLSQEALADTQCTSNSDCDKGFACMTSESTVPTACDCPANATCKCPTIPITSSCQPLDNCNADSECASGMVCSSSNCVPKWSLHCVTASDCGDGFDCVTDTMGQCSGSSGSASSASGAASAGGAASVGGAAATPVGPIATAGTSAISDTSVPTPPSCTTVNLDTKSCVPQQVECSKNDDCLAGWTCQSNSVTSCTGGVAVGQGGSGAVTTTVIPDSCTTTTATSYCSPPYAEYGRKDISMNRGTPTAAEAGNDGTSDVTGAAGSSAQAAGVDSGAVNTDSSENSGCQLGAGTARNAAGLIPMLFGLMFLRRRRSA